MSKTSTFLLKISTLQLLFIISVLPMSLLLHFGAIIKREKKTVKTGFLNTSTGIATIHLIIEVATRWLTARGHTQHGDAGPRGHSHLGQDGEGDLVMPLRGAHNLTLIIVYFSLNISGHSWLWVTKSVDSETMEKQGYYILMHLLTLITSYNVYKGNLQNIVIRGPSGLGSIACRQSLKKWTCKGSLFQCLLSTSNLLHTTRCQHNQAHWWRSSKNPHNEILPRWQLSRPLSLWLATVSST